MTSKQPAKVKRPVLPAKEIIEIDESTADPFLVLQGMAQRFAVGPVRIKVEEEEDVEMGMIPAQDDSSSRGTDGDSRQGEAEHATAMFQIRRADGVQLVAPIVAAEKAKMKESFTIEAGGARDGGASPPPQSDSGSATPDANPLTTGPFWDLGNLEAISISTQFLTDHLNDLTHLRTELTILHENLLRTRIVAAKTKHCLSRALFTTETGQDMQEEIRRWNNEADAHHDRGTA